MKVRRYLYLRCPHRTNAFIRNAVTRRSQGREHYGIGSHYASESRRDQNAKTLTYVASAADGEGSGAGGAASDAAGAAQDGAAGAAQDGAAGAAQDGSQHFTSQHFGAHLSSAHLSFGSFSFGSSHFGSFSLGR